MQIHLPPLLAASGMALAAPLLGELTRRVGLSIVVLELSLGTLVGPHGLAWTTPEGPVILLAKLGMALLFFLAGLEIDLAAIRGRPLTLATLGWVIMFGLALGATYLVQSAGLLSGWLVIGIALATTALGVLVPMLRDANLLDTPFGRYVMAAGVVGELGPILAMSIMLSRRHSAGLQSMLVLAFVSLVLVIAWASARGAAAPKFLRFVRRTMAQSSQLPVRASLFILAGLCVLAEHMGLDLAVGALAAGMTVRLSVQGEESHQLHHRLDAVGFGFLVPIFFITSGMKLDIGAVFANRNGLILTAALFVALLLVRVPAALLYRRALPGREVLALGLFSATTLSMIVALTEIAVSQGAMRAEEASPLVMAGVLSVVVCPIFALIAIGAGEARTARPFDDRGRL